jgi:transcriptional regulator with XRE-family HTH domain
MSPEQCRAARAWLDWSQDELATRARVSNSTIRDFEAGRRAPIANNARAIQHALEAGGIELTFATDGQATGIAARLRSARLPQPGRPAEPAQSLAPTIDESPIVRRRSQTRRPTFFIDLNSNR